MPRLGNRGAGGSAPLGGQARRETSRAGGGAPAAAAAAQLRAQPSSSLAVQRRLCDSSGVFCFGPGRRKGWEGGKEMKGGGEVLGNNPRLNICQTSTHTHFEKSSGCKGAGGHCRRSALTSAGGFPWKKRSQANPAGVKFHRSLSCNDIT